MANKGFWPGYDLIFFDCDSTLTGVEGIDELAHLKGKGWRVSILTERAMGGQLDISEVYERRLRAIRPTRDEVRHIARLYRDNVLPDAQAVIGALQFLDRQVFIISAGMADAVIRFGASLGVPRDHIRAVELEYDQLAGKWWDFYEHRHSGNPDARYLMHDNGPLTVSRGKAEVVRALAEGYFGRRLLVGDGASDLDAHDAVDLFIGFGGVVRRERVADESPVFINARSLTPILPLAAGPAGYRRCLGTPYAELFKQGLASIAHGEVTFRQDGRREAFLAAFDPMPK
jgi:phosphoserine phosphatase